MLWPRKPQAQAAPEKDRQLPSRALPASAHQKLDPAALHCLLEHPEPDLLPYVQEGVDLSNGIPLPLSDLSIVSVERDKLFGERRLVGACLIGHPLQFS